MDKVAIYTRLSKEDEDKLNKGDDSASIQNQKMLMVDYASNNNMQIYKIYSDDDFKGSDQTRPQWKRMLKDAENGEFNIIMCKTQSRFARDSGLIEKYIHGYFLEWGIRFISIVDNIDTNVKSTKKASQIHGLVDQWQLEDLSENIRTVFRNKMEEGQFLGSFAPYGYAKCLDNSHKLIIDEEAAEVVRLIFDLSLQGCGVDTISQKLSAMDIPTPTEYKRLKGYNYKNPRQTYTKKGLWSTTTVKRVLNNPVYIGTLTQGREKKVSYKSKKVVIAPKEEWVVIENNHEPIISKEVFEKTQKLMQIRRKTCKTTSGKKFTPHLFSGRIKCLDCHSTMAKTSGRLVGGYDYFICQLAKKSKLAECTRHSIRYDELEIFISDEIKKLINRMLNYDNNIEDIRKYFKKDTKDKKKIEDNKTHLQNNINKIEELNNAISNLYLDKTKGVITEDDFINIKDNLSNEVKKLNDFNNILKEELKTLSIDDSKIDNFMDNVIKHKDFKELTFEIVNDFIECIYIPETNDGDERLIDIVWNV